MHERGHDALITTMPLPTLLLLLLLLPAVLFAAGLALSFAVCCLWFVVWSDDKSFNDSPRVLLLLLLLLPMREPELPVPTPALAPNKTLPSLFLLLLLLLMCNLALPPAPALDGVCHDCMMEGVSATKCYKNSVRKVQIRQCLRGLRQQRCNISIFGAKSLGFRANPPGILCKCVFVFVCCTYGCGSGPRRVGGGG
jgi:hypothetical protein